MPNQILEEASANRIGWKSFFWPQNLDTKRQQSTSGLLAQFLAWRKYVLIVVFILAGLGELAISVHNIFVLKQEVISLQAFSLGVLLLISAVLLIKKPDSEPILRTLFIGVSGLGYVLAVYVNGELPLVFALGFAAFYYLQLSIRTAFLTTVGLYSCVAVVMAVTPNPLNMAIVGRQVFESILVIPALHYFSCFCRWMSDLYVDKLNARTKYVSTVSHEIRSPLNGLNGLTYILQELLAQPQNKYTHQKVSECLAQMRHLQEHLSAVVDNALLLTQGKMQQIKIRKTRVNIYTLIKSVTDSFRKQIVDKGLSLSLSPSDIFKDLTADIDAVRVKQILFNLISNAIKYTDKGKIEVNLGVLSKGELTYLKVSVSDTGLGIPKEKQYQVFEEFTQFHYSDEHLSRGNGLGLSLVKELSRSLGGECGFNSEFGKGSTFWFEVPISLSSSDNMNTANENDEEQSKSTLDIKDTLLKGLRILIVDDEPINRKVFGAMLQNRGADVHQASHGAKALELIRSHAFTFDAILMDLQMPEMDGETAAQAIRLIPRYVDVPILCISGVTDDIETRQNAFDEHLRKPVKPETLIAKVAYHCSLKSIAG